MTRANIVYKMYIGVVLDFYVTRTLQSTPRVGGHALSRAFKLWLARKIKHRMT